MHRIVFYNEKTGKTNELIKIENYLYKVIDTSISGRVEEGTYRFQNYLEFSQMIPNMVCREGYKIIQVEE